MDFKGAGSNSKSNLDSEKSVLERFETKYKNTYFWALFVVLKEEDSSKIIALVGSFILFCQQLIFPFHPSVQLLLTLRLSLFGQQMIFTRLSTI